MFLLSIKQSMLNLFVLSFVLFYRPYVMCMESNFPAKHVATQNVILEKKMAELEGRLERLEREKSTTAYHTGHVVMAATAVVLVIPVAIMGIFCIGCIIKFFKS
jgi:hypothetical protein